MKLNRNNYEEYFILYLDNELDAESRREVEAFAKQNPDLKTELDQLMQSKLAPDADIRFTDKGSLMRFDSSSISLSNYEEWLTSYIDDELTDGERRDVEVFVAGNPAIQRELNLLQQTKLQPEAIVFPYKESLYRKEEKARVISVRWWRIAAAAVLLLAISTTTIVLLNNRKGNDGADVAIKNKVVVPVNNNNTQPVTKPDNEEAPLALDKKKEERKEPRNAIAGKGKDTGREENKEQKAPVNEERQLIVNIPKEEKPNNVPPATEETAVATGKTDINIVTSQPSDVIKKAGLTNDKGDKIKEPVTPETLQPSYAVEQQSSGNKGLRGFLRKVTRTFEKRTNIKATDDDDRLLVAGLAIKL